MSKLRWYRAAPVQERQLQDAIEVYRAQRDFIDDEYLNRWAGELGLMDLLGLVRSPSSTQ